MVNADVPVPPPPRPTSTSNSTSRRRPIAAPMSPPFPVVSANPPPPITSSTRRPTSSLTVVHRDSPSLSTPSFPPNGGARLSPAEFAAAQQEAAARVAAKEEARYEQMRRERERRAVESLKVVDLVGELSEPGVSRATMKDVVRIPLHFLST